MAEAADAVVLGRIIGVAEGNTVQGDAPEDFYAEVNLQIEVEQVLRHAMGDSFQLSLPLFGVRTPEAHEPAVSAMQATLPQDPVVLFLRLRGDIEDLYTVVNGKGLWARTLNAPLDNAIDACGTEPRDPFLGDLHTLDELVAALRQD